MSRAYEQILLSQDLAAVWSGKDVHAPQIDRPEHTKAAEAMTHAQRLQAACAASKLPSGQYGEFALTQPEAVQDDSDAKESSDANVQEKIHLLTVQDPEVPAMSVGYGVDGVSAQDSRHGPKMMDDRVSSQCETLKIILVL